VMWRAAFTRPDVEVLMASQEDKVFLKKQAEEEEANSFGAGSKAGPAR